MPVLSAIIITKNEAANIAECLDSVAFCDERVVVDSGSDDDTVKIAEGRGARVSFHAFGGFGRHGSHRAQRTPGERERIRAAMRRRFGFGEPGSVGASGGETREWTEGNAFAFDDTIEHEAWNRSDRRRAVLILDTWNPHLSEREREAVAAHFAASDAALGGRAGNRSGL